MTKTGIFKNLSSDESYVVVINSVPNKGERIELYHSAEDYNPIETYNAVAAYYRKARECVYGYDDLIKEFLFTQNSCIAMAGEVKQEREFCSEGFKVTQTKENPSLGRSTRVVMVNGIISEEEYKTDKWLIVLDGDKSGTSSTIFVDPLNLREYRVVSILSNFSDNDTEDVDYYSLDYLKAKYPLDHIENYDYVVIDDGDVEYARERLDKWKNASVKLKSVDIESTGLGVSVFGEDLITGVSLSYDWEELGEVENSTYFPFRQKNFKANLPIEFLKEIQDAINSQSKASSVDPEDKTGTLILAHNGKMERKSFWQDHLNIRVDVDTYTLSTLIDTRMERGLHTLKNRAFEATGLFWLELEMVFKNKIIRFDILPAELVKYYACPDTPNTIKVFKYLMKKLPPTEYSVFEVENELQYAKSIQEYYGLRLDQQLLYKRLDNTEYIVDKLSSMFKKWHKTSRNINSADVLRNIVYVQLGCKVIVRTKKDKPSTSADAINLIVEEGAIKEPDLTTVPDDIVDKYGQTVIKGKTLKSNRYPSLVILAAYNKYRKELGALKRLQKKSIENRVMFGINGTGAASNRQTSDAHQYSDVMKELVLADTPMHTLISCDYSQVELRVLAYIIKDKRLIEQMKDKHVDIHRAFLSVITGLPIYKISAIMRSKGKRVNFGVVYGISEFGLTRDQYGPKYTDEQLLESKQSITDFMNGIPGCKKLAEENRKFIFEHGYIETAFGYRRMLPKALEPGLTDAEKARIFRMGNNTPVQGFAAHMMKRAENNFNRYIRNMGWDKTITYMGKEFPRVRVMLSIHDEVLISADKSIEPEEIVLMCKKCMEIEFPDAPPFFAVPAFVDNWYQGKSDEYEMSVSMRDDILDAWQDGHRRIVDWDNLSKSIKDYKLSQIKGYMTDLIKKYKTEEEVYAHVTHPEYTHLLIAIYVTKDMVKTHDHMECIRLAVHAYMENPENYVDVSSADHFAEMKEDENIQDGASYIEEFENYVEVDENGEVIVPDESESAIIDEDDTSYRDSYIRGDDCFYTAKIDIVYLLDVVLIDTSDIETKEELLAFNKEVTSLCTDDGYYQVDYMRGESVVSTKLRMDPKQKELQAILDKYKKKGVKT